MPELWYNGACAIASFAVCAFAVEAISEIVTASKLFSPLHNLLAKAVYPRPNAVPNSNVGLRFAAWLYSLITCGYCFSVWAALSVAWLIPDLATPHNLTTTVAVYFIKAMALHRLSNWLHISYKLHQRGRVATYDLKVVHEGLPPTVKVSFDDSPTPNVKSI